MIKRIIYKKLKLKYVESKEYEYSDVNAFLEQNRENYKRKQKKEPSPEKSGSLNNRRGSPLSENSAQRPYRPEEVKQKED
jgi:hypothetical protein